MNKARRVSLRLIVEELDNIKAAIVELRDEETEYRDNMPENMQASEKYDRADEVIGLLHDAEDTINELVDTIEEAI